ncbi:MAG: hypothetical protein AAFY09_14005 [Pseudomonadota bacterium]
MRIKQRLFLGLWVLCLAGLTSASAEENSIDTIAQAAMARWRCSTLATILGREVEAQRLYGSGKKQMRKFADNYVQKPAASAGKEGQFALILSLTFDAIPRHIVENEPIDVSLGLVFARTQTRVIAELKTVIGGENGFDDVLQTHLQTVKNQYSAFNCQALSDGEPK